MLKSFWGRAIALPAFVGIAAIAMSAGRTAAAENVEPKFKIKKQAENGRIVADVIKTTFPATHKRCAGKPIQVFVVGYKPNRGYRGKDSALVSMRYEAYSNESFGANRTVRFNISVK